MLKRPSRLATAALSRASSRLISGSRPAKRWASIDLPEPGGPLINRLWWPAAAISSARLAAAWPLTSLRSGPWVAWLRAGASTRTRPVPGSGSAAGPSLGVQAKACTTSSRWLARQTGMSGTRAASSALPGGSTSCTGAPPWRCRARLMASAPLTGRNSPDSDSSPANSWPARRAGSICSLAASRPRAMGRSKRPESLGRSAGARLTVMRLLCGNSSPAFCSAERTRSRASLTSTSANPTRVKLGRPLARCTSTVTGKASKPSKTRLCTKERPIFMRSCSSRHQKSALGGRSA